MRSNEWIFTATQELAQYPISSWVSVEQVCPRSDSKGSERRQRHESALLHATRRRGAVGSTGRLACRDRLESTDEYVSAMKGGGEDQGWRKRRIGALRVPPVAGDAAIPPGATEGR
jgi:hypothetical protein